MEEQVTERGNVRFTTKANGQKIITINEPAPVPAPDLAFLRGAKAPVWDDVQVDAICRSGRYAEFREQIIEARRPLGVRVIAPR